MNVTVNMKKVVIVIVLIALFCGGVWWYMGTAPQRKADAEIKIMIDVVQRQALEIAFIENSFKLADYRQQVAAANKPVPPIVPTPIAPEPVVPDPKSLPEE